MIELLKTGWQQVEAVDGHRYGCCGAKDEHHFAVGEWVWSVGEGGAGLLYCVEHAPEGTPPNPNVYPEHEKLTKMKDKSQAIGEFLEWLQEERYGFLATYDAVGDMVHLDGSIQYHLAEYFDIDRDKLEEEKRAMLDALRKKTT